MPPLTPPFDALHAAYAASFATISGGAMRFIGRHDTPLLIPAIDADYAAAR